MLTGRTAIITGAGRGIGAAIATAFARQGANVMLNTRSDSDVLKETLAALADHKDRVRVCLGDVAEAETAKRLAAETEQAFGGIDILVNNAGIIRDKPITFLGEDDWDKVIDTNLKGAFLVTKQAIKPMVRNRWGRVINISSISALAGRPGQTNYGAAKAGLLGFTKSLAREMGRHNVLVNAAIVGVVDTRMTKQIPREILKEITEMVPLGRIGRPEEIANVCLFLASEMSSYVTGATINVSGGGYI